MAKNGNNKKSILPYGKLRNSQTEVTHWQFKYELSPD